MVTIFFQTYCGNIPYIVIGSFIKFLLSEKNTLVQVNEKDSLSDFKKAFIFLICFCIYFVYIFVYTPRKALNFYATLFFGMHLKNRKWVSFKKARKFARELNLSTYRDWIEYCKSGKRPIYIPANPAQTYRSQFTGYGDWLGTGTVSTHKIIFLPFKKARKFVHKLELRSRKEWEIYCKSGAKPKYIPLYPNKIYKDKYIDMAHWLGSSGSSKTPRLKLEGSAPKIYYTSKKNKNNKAINSEISLRERESKEMKRITILEKKVVKLERQLQLLNRNLRS